jgi:hypothetical protein
VSKRRRNTVIEIDVRDYLDDMLDEALDTRDAIYMRDCLEDARRCLNRPERTPAEAIEYIERALGIIAQALK